MDGSPSKAADVRAACSSKRPGRPHRHQDRCAPSSCASGHAVASIAAVATARRLAVVIWYLLTKGESYAWARPSLHAKKLRDVELKAGNKAVRGQKGAAHAYNIKSHRDEERRWAEQAESAYASFVAGWNPRGPRQARTDAANEVRR